MAQNNTTNNKIISAKKNKQRVLEENLFNQLCKIDDKNDLEIKLRNIADDESK